MCLLFFTLLILGCKSVQPIVIENRTTDSVFVHEHVRDTIVELQRDSSTLKALIECDSIGNAHILRILELENGSRLVAPSISISDNILQSTAKVDSQAIYLALKDTYTTQVKETVVTQVREVNVLSWWQKLWCTLGKVLSGIILIYVLMGLLKIE
ncbi:MAG: hypothetical protein R3Y26_11690 [Rikenellaceae bacterium]